MSNRGRLNLSKARLTLVDNLLREEGLERRPVQVVNPRADRDVPAPLTVQQTQMWFLDHLMTGQSPYVIVGGLRVRGPFLLDTFAQACRQVTGRHESLRTVFADTDGHPVQHVRDDLPPEVVIEDLSHLSAQSVADEISRRHRELAGRSFDLRRGPLLRVLLLRFGSEDAAVLFSMHHIISDLWSMSVLMREVMQSYAAIAQGRAAQLPPLAAQYSDYALWQRSPESEAAIKAELDYWVERLRDVPPDTGLVTDRPRPSEKSYRGASVPVMLSPAVVARLRELARSEGSTLFMAFAAVFKVLLARLSGGDDIVVGTPVAGRPLAELEPLIGCFVNTVTLRTDASGNPTFREFLRRVTRVSLDAFERQNVHFERIVAELRPDRGLSRNPLFQVMFSYQNVPMPSANSGLLRVEPIEVDTATAKFDLQLDLIEDGPAIWGRLVYSTDLFDEVRARDMAKLLHRLADALAADPGLRIGEVPLLDADERGRLLAWGRGPQVSPAQVGAVHELFGTRAQEHPDDIAVVCGEHRLTYRELDRRSGVLARRLRELGVGDESVVGLCLPTGADLITAIVGTWKAGAAYLPLDPDWPSERVEFTLGDSCAAAVIARRGVEAELGEHTVLWFDDLPEDDDLSEDDDNPDRDQPDVLKTRNEPDRLAYIIYTSGSTGRPKGVQVTHAGLLSYLAGVPGMIGLGGPGRRYAVLQGAVTDFANTIIFTSLVTGGALHLLDRHSATDPEYVADYLARERIDYLKMVPSHLAALTAEVGAARLWPARTLVLGGEAASAGQVSALCAAAGDRSLFNHYGPTETTIGVATTPLTPQLVSHGFVPIGKPVANTSLYVLDEHLAPVPVGVAGQLYVGGAQVARGYLNQPELTAQRFVDDPFAADGCRMYRTGDRVCWTATGHLRFLGRVDDQVKIRGFRVEPQEIEALLAADPQVDRAVVLARADTPGTTRLVGYVTANPGADPDPARLRTLVARTLPEHMVPAAVVVLQRLPLTANGKVDRAALPAPDFTAEAGSRPPRTPAEHLLCQVFAQVLGLPEVGVEDGFFELGGDSIQAIAVVSAARAAGLEFDTRDVFVHQSAAALAEIAASVEERLPTTHDEGIGRIPATPVIERLRTLETDIRRYSHRVLVTVPAEADLARLAAVLGAVLTHHGALRARLDAAAGRGWSLLVEPADSPTPQQLIGRVDVQGLDEAEFRRVLTAQTAAAVDRLDPFAGVNVQALWFDAGRGAQGRLLLVIHHLVVDGVSWRVLLSDLRSAWESVTAEREVRLPAVGTSFRRWAQVLSAEAGRPARSAELTVWREVLRDAEPFVTGRHDPGLAVRQLTVTLPAADAAPLLSNIPSAFGVGVQDVLLAAFGIALSEWQRRRRGGSGAVVVEVEGHGRVQDLAEGLDLSRSVGWFTTVYPVRLDPGSLTWRQVGEADTALRDAVVDLTGQLRALPADGLGFGLLRYLNPATATELATLPTPQIVFNYLGRMAGSGKPSAWEPVTDFVAETSSPAAGLGPLLTRPLHLNAFAVDGADGPQFVAEWAWSQPLWTDGDIASLAEAFSQALHAIVVCAGRSGMRLRPITSAGPITSARSGPISRVDHDSPLPLSFQQLNSVYQPAGADSAHHNVIAGIVLSPRPGAQRPELDEAALARSLDRIAQRHEVLRTRIRKDESGWIQQVDPAGSWPLRSVDLRGLDETQRSQALHEVIAQEQALPFVLAEGRPMRTTVVRTAEHEWTLIMVLHHIVIDPWGYAQLQNELAELYEADVVGREPRLPELPIQYPEYAAWQQRQLADGVFDAHLAYWEQLLEELPAPPSFDAPAHQKTTEIFGYTLGFVLDEAVTKALKEAARRCGVTLFMFLLSAYHALQSIYSRSEDVLVTFPLAGREQGQTRNLIGYFINEVIVRTRVPWQGSFRDLIAVVRDGTLNGHAHQNAPLRVRHSGKGGYDPFRIMFNLVNYEPFRLDLYGLRATHLADVGDGSDDAVIPEVITAMRPNNLDLYLAMHERDGCLNGLWLYSPDFIDPQVMAAMTRAWPVLLDAVVRDPDQTLHGLRDEIWASSLTAGGDRR